MRIFKPGNIANFTLKNKSASDFWYVDSWDIHRYLPQTDNIPDVQGFDYDCWSVINGLKNTVNLKNINGKYLLSNFVYNNSPVYINNKENMRVIDSDFKNDQNLSDLTSNEIRQIIEDDILLYRDGPYLLGKFAPDGSWAIIEFPNANSQNQSQELFDLENNIWFDVEKHIVVYQKGPQPPEKYLNFKTQTVKNTRYNSWVDAVSPLSRSWQINLKYPTVLFCGQSDQVEAKSHFSFWESTKPDTNKLAKNRGVINIESSLPFAEKVYRQFIDLIEFIAGDNSYFILPTVQKDFDIILTSSDIDDPDNCLFSDIDLNIKSIFIHGEFQKTNSVRSIVGGAKYNIKNIRLVSNTDAEQVVLFDDIKYGLLSVATTERIRWVQKNLTRWAKNSAFLVPPPVGKFFWEKYNIKYLEFFSDFNQDKVFVSKFSKKYKFSTINQRDYYDRLYEFMLIGDKNE